jgi:DNA (cytosine-5)-methyltransferase 1
VADTKDITVLSLCTGYGGLELGLSRALENPLRVVAVEVEAYALANLVAKAEAGKLAIEAMWPDLRTFPAERFRGCFDFIIAGYPCQPFSVAGKREGKDDPRHLWPAISRIVQAVEPVWCFFENVPGHLTLGFPSVYRSLRDMGYSVEAGLFTAAECGASIAGERLYILAKADCLRKLQPQGGKRYERRWLNNSSAPPMATPQSKGHTTSKPRRDKSPRPRLTNCCSTVRAVALQDEEQYDWEDAREIKPKLDGTTNGLRNWHDRLRLLGNGVVPQQAEKAFRYLMQKQGRE